MVQSEVRRARQRQEAARNPDTTAKVNEFITLINRELPETLAKMRKHDFPAFSNKLYAAGLVKVDGHEKDVWVFTSGANFERDMRAAGGFRENGGPQLGIMFAEVNGIAVRVLIIGHANPSDPFKVYKRSDLEQLAPARLNGLLQVVKGLQNEPQPPKHHVPYIDPATVFP